MINDLIVVTNNVGEFERIPWIKVEDGVDGLQMCDLKYLRYKKFSSFLLAGWILRISITFSITTYQTV